MATKQKNWQKEWEQISAESKRLAKRANQRLVRLEQYSSRAGLSSITKYAYAKASDYIKSNLGLGKGGKARLKEHIKLFDINDGTKQLSGQALYKANVMIQRQRIKAMEEFLAAESSTLGQSRSGPKTIGIKKIYENRAKTITDKYLDKYGLEMSENDLKRFFDSKKQAKLEKIVGSKQMFVVASVIKKLNIRGSRKELEKFVKSHVDLNQYKDDAPDLNMSAKESRAKYLERLRDHIKYTNDPVLNDMVTNALKEGINAKNIFI